MRFRETGAREDATHITTFKATPDDEGTNATAIIFKAPEFTDTRPGEDPPSITAPKVKGTTESGHRWIQSDEITSKASNLEQEVNRVSLQPRQPSREEWDDWVMTQPSHSPTPMRTVGFRHSQPRSPSAPPTDRVSPNQQEWDDRESTNLRTANIEGVPTHQAQKFMFKRTGQKE